MKKYAILLATLFAAAAMPALAEEDAPAAMARPKPTVSTQKTITISASEPRTYIGSVEADEEVQLVARVAGYLWKIAFEEGSIVKEGDLLFEIEDTIYKANAEIAQAKLDQAMADLDYTKREFERHEEMLSEHAVAESTFDDARRAKIRAEAAVAEAKANLALMQNDLAYTKVYAPITGQIGKRAYSEGNYLSGGGASTILATIVKFDPIRVRFPMSERDYFDYFPEPGKMKNIEMTIIRANGVPFAGKTELLFVDNIVDGNTNTIMITLSCENPGLELIPGGFVHVNLAERYEKVLTAVNVSAVMTDGTTHYVYLFNREQGGTVERRDIVIGDLVGGMQTVLAGLEPGEEILVGGMNKVSPGMQVDAIERKELAH